MSTGTRIPSGFQDAALAAIDAFHDTTRDLLIHLHTKGLANEAEAVCERLRPVKEALSDLIEAAGANINEAYALVIERLPREKRDALLAGSPKLAAASIRIEARRAAAIPI